VLIVVILVQTVGPVIQERFRDMKKRPQSRALEREEKSARLSA
jgi:hypothetical protein